MTADDLPVIISEWRKNSQQTVKVALDKFHDNNTVDLRVWYDDNGISKPSKLGVTLGIRHLPELAEAINKALAEARRRGAVADVDHREGDAGEPHDREAAP